MRCSIKEYLDVENNPCLYNKLKQIKIIIIQNHKNGMDIEDITRDVEEKLNLFYDNEEHIKNMRVVKDIIIGKSF